MKAITAIVALMLMMGCKKSGIDSAQQILGKWEIFYLGNGEFQPAITSPSGYRQFMADSMLIEYDYATKTARTKKYWMDAQLHIGTLRPDGYLLKSDYSYKFYADTLELSVENATAIFAVSKHKRIN